jgi:outer membrane protein assembly factor BamB
MRGRGSTASAEVMPGATASTPPPARFEVHVRSRLDGAVGERPQEEVGRRTNQLRVSWPDRQIGTAVEGTTMYVANHFQVAAYSLTSGERIWQSQTPTGSMQRSEEWGLIPMRPLVVGDRIFARLLYSPGPLLACLDKATGKLIWTAESRDREFLVSDPLLVQGQLVMLGIAVQPDLVGQLRFYSFDMQTGETLRQHDLVRLRNTWGARSCCEVVEVEDGLVAALGGVTIGVDAKGTLRWVRSHVTLPADEDPRWILQIYQRPLVKGEHVLIAQPGVRTVDCLSAATGRQVWSTVHPEVLGMVGLAGEMLIVRTQSDIRALDLKDGSVRWRHAADDLFSFQLVDDSRLLVASRERALGESDRWQVRLTWIDPMAGTPLTTSALSDLADSDPRLGPLVPYNNRLFTFFGRGQHDPTRDIVELVPAGDADPPPPQPDAWHERLGR